MKYSLRSLMIVAILGPAAIAGSYFVTRWLIEWQSPPPLISPWASACYAPVKYALAAIELAISVALAAGMIVGLWWASRDKNAPKKYIVWECVCLVLIVIAIGALAWTAIDYAVIQDMH